MCGLEKARILDYRDTPGNAIMCLRPGVEREICDMDIAQPLFGQKWDGYTARPFAQGRSTQ
jgi:hypothetical protein